MGGRDRRIRGSKLPLAMQEFQDSLGYVRSCLRKKKSKDKNGSLVGVERFSVVTNTY